MQKFAFKSLLFAGPKKNSKEKFSAKRVFSLANIASRAMITLTYWAITLLTCIQVMIRGSLLVGALALVGCALCYWGAAAYIGALARLETRIGVLAVILIMAGQALMIWSGFMISLFDIEIGGAFWALIGAASAIVRIDEEKNCYASSSITRLNA